MGEVVEDDDVEEAAVCFALAELITPAAEWAAPMNSLRGLTLADEP